MTRVLEITVMQDQAIGQVFVQPRCRPSIVNLIGIRSAVSEIKYAKGQIDGCDFNVMASFYALILLFQEFPFTNRFIFFRKTMTYLCQRRQPRDGLPKLSAISSQNFGQITVWHELEHHPGTVSRVCNDIMTLVQLRQQCSFCGVLLLRKMNRCIQLLIFRRT